MSACFRVTVTTSAPVALPWSNEGVDQARPSLCRSLVVSAADMAAAEAIALEIGTELAGGRAVTVEHAAYLHRNDHAPAIPHAGRDTSGRFARAA